MNLIFGRRCSEQKFGYVADVCPKCQQVRCMKLSRCVHGPHLFAIRCGQGITLGFALCCEHCRTEVRCDPTWYAEVLGQRKTPLEDLVRHTNPNLMASVEMAQANRLRYVALVTPFQRAHQVFTERYIKGDHTDGRVALALLGVLASFVVGYYVGAIFGMLFGANDLSRFHYEVVSVLVVLAISVAWLVMECKNEPKRFFRKRLFSVLVRELALCRPKEAELEELFRRLAKYYYPVAEVTSVKEVREGLAAPVVIPRAAAVC